MSRHLAVYTDLIATARANDNVGNPVGVAYLREASALMQNTICPWPSASTPNRHARLLRHPDAHRPASGDRDHGHDGGPDRTRHRPHVSSRKSRRRCNPGLIVAALLGVSHRWLVVAGVVSTSASERRRPKAREPLSVVTKARILAQQARADETLALLQPGSDSSEGNYVWHARRSPRYSAGIEHY